METSKTQNNIPDSTVTVENRRFLKITGAEKLFYSTQTETLVQTTYGRLQITGTNINVRKVAIEQNTVELEGRFNSIKYVGNEKTKPRSVLGVFKRG